MKQVSEQERQTCKKHWSGLNADQLGTESRVGGGGVKNCLGVQEIHGRETSKDAAHLIVTRSGDPDYCNVGINPVIS